MHYINYSVSSVLNLCIVLFVHKLECLYRHKLLTFAFAFLLYAAHPDTGIATKCNIYLFIRVAIKLRAFNDMNEL